MKSGIERVEEQLRLLSRGYAERLPDRVKHIEAVWGRALAGGWEEPERAALNRTVHELKGSGGTLGFPMITNAARVLELSLITIGAEDHGPTLGQRQEVGAQIGALRKVAEQARRNVVSL